MAGTITDKLEKLEETKAALKSAINGSGNIVGEKFSDYPVAVINGRATIAAAITEMGVATENNATSEQMAENIKNIGSGGETGVITISYYGVNNATCFYIDNEGIYRNITNPASINLIIPSIIGVYVSPKSPMDTGGGPIIESLSGCEVVKSLDSIGLVSSRLNSILVTQLSASLTVS